MTVRSGMVGEDDLFSRDFALTRSTPLSSTILDCIAEHVYVLDRTGRILHVNGAVARALGVTGDQLVGMNLHEIGPASHVLEPLERKVARVFESGEPVSGGTPLPSGGRLLPFDYDLRPVRGGDGRVQSVIMTARDVSQAELAMKQLQALESITDATISDMDVESMLQEVLLRLVSLLQSDTASVLLVADDGAHLIRRASVGLERQHPETMPIPIGRGLSGRIAKTVRPLVVEDLATEEVLSRALREHVHSLAGVPLKVRGRCVGVVHVGSRTRRAYTERDVDLLIRAADRVAVAVERARMHADEKSSRAQAERERDRLRALIDSMLDEVWACDAEGRITLFNGAALRTLGFEPADLQNAQVLERAASITALRPDGSPRAPNDNPMVRALRGELVQEEEVVGHQQTGELRYRYVSAAPVRDAQGRITGAVATARDVTEERRAAQESERQRRTLELSQQHLKQAKESAERATRAKDEFLAMLSHELRNPLTPALLTVQSFESDERLPPEARNEMATVRRSIELEARLIDDLLDITRIARGKLTLSPRPLDVHELIKTTVHVCRPDIIDKGVELLVQLDAAHSWARVDGARMQQVLWNLVKNAIKFTPRGRKIRLCTMNAEGQLHIEVNDEGVGIEPTILPTIFDAFVQGPAGERHPSGGLGLGLSISRMLVHLQGGRIEAESAGLGHGATFVVTLPVVESARSLSRQSVPPMEESRPLHVLVVEDDRTTALVLTRLLGRLGHDAVSAGTVGEALAAAENRRFDLVLSDLGLPDGSGHEVMRWFAHRGVRGIALSGFGAENDLQASQDAGFARHMVKPIDFDQLRRAISEVMR